jgi:T-complex protein 1 subunit delta
MTEAPQAQKSNVQKEGSFNKSEKTKDVRSTNIQAAKGIFIF